MSGDRTEFPIKAQDRAVYTARSGIDCFTRSRIVSFVMSILCIVK